MQIDWWTFVLQSVNFLVLVWLLWRFLYRPVKEIIEKRKALAEKAFAEAETKGQEAEAARRRFETDRAGLARERQTMLTKVHGELQAERETVLEQARQEAEQMVEDARKSIDEQRQAALVELREQAAELAAELAADLLRQAGVNASGDVFLEQLSRQLAELEDDERERLRKDLAEEGARLTVVTSAPLTSEEKARWSDRLSASLDQAGKTDFISDPEILGGAELRFPHAVIRLTWADQLRKAEELLRGDETAS